ncbi:hypothetical protein PUN28_001684 [Cardiocondyla obscurior]|uniref:Secreted protein n=1 Tax=Cardiocondyla obscurior TaxID=286306 RepID=A0AAW2GQR1_9HYME
MLRCLIMETQSFYTWNGCLSVCPGICCVSVICHASSCCPNESGCGCDCRSAYDLCRGYATYCEIEIANAYGLCFCFVICEHI